MTIRKSTILTICIVLVVMLLVSYLIAQSFLLGSFTSLEEHEVREDTERVVGALNSRITWLKGTTSDWAFWDDTYTFADNLNTDYINKNIAPTTFMSLQLDAFVLTNTTGELLYGQGYDSDKGNETDLPQGLLAYLTNNNPLKSPSIVDSCIAGVIILPGGPMIIASCPVLTSERTGPPHGILTMARYLDASEITQLAETTLLPITIYPVNSYNMPSDFTKALQQLSQGKSLYIFPQDNKTISGYTLVDDNRGQPVLILRTDIARDIYSKGRESVLFILTVLIVCAIIAGIVAIVFQNRIALSRINRLNKDIQQISASENISSRIKVTGKDELSNLAGNINNMLSTIEKHNTEEANLRQTLEVEMSKRADYTRELAHELKTPLTPILSSSELLSENIKDEPWVSLAKNIYRGASDMNDRLDDLLDMAKGEIGILALSLEEINPLLLLRQVAEELSPLIKHRQQTLVLDLPAELPHIMGDEVRLRQVLRNLLNNATKFTPEQGKITIRGMQDGNNLVVEIEDTGRGIDADKLSKVFTPYVRLGDDKEHQKGLGLGLKLCKTLVELHNGHIWVKSQKGKGSVFSFSIPVTANQGKDIPKKRKT